MPIFEVQYEDSVQGGPRYKDGLRVGADGSKYWSDSNGKLHRADGPAIQYSEGIDVWYKHGRRHREDGPAMMYLKKTCADGWWLNGILCTFEEWLCMVKLSDEEKVMFKLKYG